MQIATYWAIILSNLKLLLLIWALGR